MIVPFPAQHSAAYDLALRMAATPVEALPHWLLLGLPREILVQEGYIEVDTLQNNDDDRLLA